jgi:hypothetical protein
LASAILTTKDEDAFLRITDIQIVVCGEWFISYFRENDREDARFAHPGVNPAKLVTAKAGSGELDISPVGAFRETPLLRVIPAKAGMTVDKCLAWYIGSLFSGE